MKYQLHNNMDNMAKANQTTKKTTGRAKPMVTKNAYTKTKRRYGCGGKLKK